METTTFMGQPDSYWARHPVAEYYGYYIFVSFGPWKYYALAPNKQRINFGRKWLKGQPICQYRDIIGYYRDWDNRESSSASLASQFHTRHKRDVKRQFTGNWFAGQLLFPHNSWPTGLIRYPDVKLLTAILDGKLTSLGDEIMSDEEEDGDSDNSNNSSNHQGAVVSQSMTSATTSLSLPFWDEVEAAGDRAVMLSSNSYLISNHR